MANSKELIKIKHPVWSRRSADWAEWWLTYKGGRDYINSYLYRQKRETSTDFKNRRTLTSNPGDAAAVVDIIAKSLACKLPDIAREGDRQYLEWAANDVDNQMSSLNSFIANEEAAKLIALGECWGCMDMPPKVDGATQANRTGDPFVWTILPQDVQSYTFDRNGRLKAILIKETVDDIDADFGLTNGTKKQYRYMRLIANDNGPNAVEVMFIDSDGELIEIQTLPWSRIPVYRMTLPYAMMEDLARMNHAILNGKSLDMDYLRRANIPLLVQQNSNSVYGIGIEAITEVNPDTGEETQGRKQRTVKAGPDTVMEYEEGTNPPAFIHPSAEPTKLSLEYLKEHQQDIRRRADLMLTNLSVSALEQSGKSKLADRVGEDKGVQVIVAELQNGDREKAEIFHMLIGSSAEYSVNYPEGFTLQTPEEIQAYADGLDGLKAKVRSETYQKEVDKRIVEVVMRPIADRQRIEVAKKEVDDAPWFDASKDRTEIIEKDFNSGLVSANTASKMRGYADGEADNAAADREIAGDLQSGADITQPTDEEINPGLQDGDE